MLSVDEEILPNKVNVVIYLLNSHYTYMHVKFFMFN